MEATIAILKENAPFAIMLLLAVMYLSGDIQDLRTDMVAGDQAIRADMTEEFRAVRAEIAAGDQAIRANMTEEFKAIRADMAEEFKAVRTEMTAGDQAIRAELSITNERLARVEARLAAIEE